MGRSKKKEIGEVVEEYFPQFGSKKHKTFYRFNVYHKKTDKLPLFSSGRFRTEEGAQRALDKYLSGDGSYIFGDCNRKGV